MAGYYWKRIESLINNNGAVTATGGAVTFAGNVSDNSDASWIARTASSAAISSSVFKCEPGLRTSYAGVSTSTVTTAALVSSSTWRYTTAAAHGFTVGCGVTITGLSAGNNGTFTVTAVASTTFDVTNASGVAQSGATGTAVVGIAPSEVVCGVYGGVRLRANSGVTVNGSRFQMTVSPVGRSSSVAYSWAGSPAAISDYFTPLTTSLFAGVGLLTFTGSDGVTYSIGTQNWTRGLVDATAYAAGWPMQIWLYDNSTTFASAVRFYEAYAIVQTRSLPTVSAVTVSDGSSTASIGSPATLTLSKQPTVNWTYADTDGELQTYYEVCVYPASIYNTIGFSPFTSTYTAQASYRTTGTSSSINSTIPSTALSNQTYRAYVRVGKPNLGATAYSTDNTTLAFTYAQFTLTTLASSSPVNVPVTATWDSTNQRVALTIPPAFNNLLSNAAANMEGTSPAGAWGDSVNNDVTAPVTNISSISFITPTVTVNTSTAHGLTIGNKITIAGTTAGGNQGTFYVLTVPSTTQFTITNASGAAQVAGPGTVTKIGYPQYVSNPTASAGIPVPQAYQDTQSLAIRAYAAGHLQAVSYPTFSVTGSAAYYCTAFTRSTVNTRTARLCMAWYDGSGSSRQVSATVTTAALVSGSTWRYTTSAAHTFTVGQNVLITAMSAVGNTGVFTITAVTSTTFDVTNATGAAATAQTGVAQVGNSFGTATTTSTSAWTPITSGIFTAPSWAVTAQPYIMVEQAGITSGEIHFFDRYMVTPIDSSITVRTNLCTNPSFETNNGNWTPASATITQDTTRYLTGTASGLIGWSNGVAVDGATVYNTLTGLSIGQQYTISFYAYTPTGGPDIAAYCATIGNGTTSTTKDAWVRVSYTFTATATSHQIGIRNKSITGTSTSTWIDAVLIEQSATVNDYFDGNVTSPYYGGFLGAANASASQTYFGWLSGGYTLPSITVQRTDSIVTTQAVRAYRSLTATTSTLQYFTLGHTKETYYDYEAARGTTVSYRSQMLVVSGTGALATAWSTTDTFNPAISITSTSDGKNWLKVIDSPTLSRSVSMADKPTFALDEEVAMFKPRGRGYSLAISGGLYGTGGTLQLISTTASDWATLKLVVEFKGTLLWQDAFGRQRWIRLTKRSYDQQGPVGREIRFVKCDYVEVGPN